MAGHNKWSKIKRDKASNDARRGALFTKLGNQIALAARAGTDPASNPALALVIETAKSFNMPLATIDRAIKRLEAKNALSLEEIVYEAFGPGSAGLLIEVATDNRKRTYPDIKTILNRNGGRIADSGSVSFLFERRGQISLKASGDQATLAVLEAGAIDAWEVDDRILVQTRPADLHSVCQKLKDQSYVLGQAGLIYQAKSKISLADDQLERLSKLVDALDDQPDVVQVYDNVGD